MAPLAVALVALVAACEAGAPPRGPASVQSARAAASAPAPPPPRAAAPTGTPDHSLPPRRLFFAPPERVAVKLSPDGAWVSYLARVNGVHNVFVAPADDPARAVAVTHETARSVRSYTWAFTSRHVLFRRDEGGDENFHVHSVDVVSRVDKDLTPLPRVQARIEARSRLRPAEVVLGLNDRAPRFHDLYAVNVATGARRLVVKNDAEMSSFVLDASLRPRVATRNLPDGSAELFTPSRAGAFAPLGKVPAPDALTTTLLGVDGPGKRLFLTDSRGRDTAALVAIDLASGEARVLVDDGQADVEGATLDPSTQAPQAAQATYDRVRWHLVGDALAPDLEALRELAHGDAFDIVTRSLDDARWLVAVHASDAPTRYYRYDRPRAGRPRDDAKRTTTLLFSASSALETLPLEPMHARVVRSRDGLSLVSYLTLPRGTDPDHDGRPTAPVPMVLVVHAGPWSRDSWGLVPEAQWLASRGYAVLAVNFRGSTGFGKGFVDAADHEWGGKMHADLLDAVAWAEAEGIAIKGRTALVGGAYGGFATLAALALTPTAFACGVDIAGSPNLASLLGAIPPAWTDELEQLRRRVGDPGTAEGRALLVSRSPLTHAAQVQRPLLVGHGARDKLVPQADVDQLVAAAKAAGASVTYAVYPDEGHGLARPENQASFNALTEVFLARCLGGKYEPLGDLSGSSIEVREGKAHVDGLAEALPAPR